ncbi:MAG: hypothetical protein Q8P95_00530 [bacterium]|nr:hypothetical protein [bacterium]
MMMKFEYCQYEAVTGVTVARPAIPVTFLFGGKNYPSGFSIIDSGSDHIILPAAIAKIFNIQLSRLEKFQIKAANGEYFSIHKSFAPMELILKKVGHVSYRWETHVYFSKETPCVLLGVEGFLDHLIVELDGVNKYTRIVKP